MQGADQLFGTEGPDGVAGRAGRAGGAPGAGAVEGAAGVPPGVAGAPAAGGGLFRIELPPLWLARHRLWVEAALALGAALILPAVAVKLGAGVAVTWLTAPGIAVQRIELAPLEPVATRSLAARLLGPDHPRLAAVAARSSFAVTRVSSQAIRSACRRNRAARGERSSRLPMGDATM